MPRADIEIDLDMESTDDGVYMWGAYVTDRANTGITREGYRAFVRWEPPTPDTETVVFREFWDWLTGVRLRVAEAGWTVRAYCWHEGAENREMRRITAPDEVWAGEVAAFIASGEWVDMERVFKAGWITGEGTSLKAIAPLAGHVWEAGEAQAWLEAYNRGDVEATVAIREWLERHMASGETSPIPDR